jgi:2Fe-2S ferredoxin
MPTIYFAYGDGTLRKVEGDAGDTVMRVAVAHDVAGILADCGGSMSCGTCHVRIADHWQARVPPPAIDETAMLEMVIDPDANSRLACQIVLTAALDGLVVGVPAAQI